MRASPLTSITALGSALGVPIYGQYGTMVGLAERPPLLFPPGEPSSSSQAWAPEESERALGPSRVEDKVSSVDSDEVDSVVRALMSDGESTTLEADEDEDPHEIIPEEDDEDALADLYMPPNEADSAASVEVDADWMKICRENRCCIKGPIHLTTNLFL